PGSFDRRKRRQQQVGEHVPHGYAYGHVDCGVDIGARVAWGQHQTQEQVGPNRHEGQHNVPQAAEYAPSEGRFEVLAENYP
ncbi:hypothetical protein DF186_22060, partial [Enterococcus hirae]